MTWWRPFERLSAPTLRGILLANLAAQIGIVVTGGLVRLTGSGLGCPTWPECTPGSYTPVVHQAEGLHKYIEFGNRTLTSVVSLTAILAILVSWELVRRGGERRLRFWSAAILAGVALQAVIGGVTVLTGLNPWTVAAHFLASMVLVAVSTATWDVALPGQPTQLIPSPLRWLVAATTSVGAVVLALGTVVTGSGPHSGDADTPARTGFDPKSISWLHADAVMLFTGLVVGLLAVTVVLGAADLRRRAAVLAIVTVLQAVIGYTQYILDLPAALVILHMLGACLLVVALVRVVTPLRRPRARQDGASEHVIELRLPG